MSENKSNKNKPIEEMSEEEYNLLKKELDELEAKAKAEREAYSCEGMARRLTEKYLKDQPDLKFVATEGECDGQKCIDLSIVKKEDANNSALN